MNLKNQILNKDILDDNELWAELKAGDEQAFSILFKRYYGCLLQYGNTFLPFSEKVQDCVQDVFTDIWVYRNSLSSTVVVKAYLLSSVRKRIVRLQQRDRVFNKSKSVDAIEFLFDFSVEHRLVSDELTAGKVMQLNKVLNVLPSRQKEALYLRYHNSLSVDEIAVILNVNYQSANNLLHRGLLNIRKEWKGDLTLLMMLLMNWI
ncbi:RNA polymerase sigma factor, sigma-70 family [Flavobacterium glycines]|uniref:DNA-directed RNA polymerase sigma-70 factor n=1 Tax=Flavobacterium glycines TaxID=551990 RepID=A0A1B9DMV1_9FLAO|nr:sigma-70 family RNA polymerase sigma factor [Flavobacterium glycines]OCB71027.1 RNA polymerase subunit sigma-24 [Flavobacterium glycines]GEL10840.1 DNA-directed RNA polymerase sigma-70 factor [Flavobacterium glycines]SDI51906.1 RNA polymerase sigma factor, sigma-70 family [Flavobacterium glycines]